MTGNIKKALRTSAALTLALVLCLTGLSPVWAANYSTSGVEGTDATAALTKVLELPEGTKVPDSTFTFEFEGLAFNGDESKAGQLPTIGDITVDFIEADTAKAVTNTATHIATVKKQSADFVASLGSTNFETLKEGRYAYIASEKLVTYDAASGYTIDQKDSNLAYRVELWVAKKDSDYYIQYIQTQLVEDENGDAIAEDKWVKVDPTPGDPDGNPDNFSKMEFTNTAVKTLTDDDPTTGDSILEISSAVGGVGASDSQYFPYSITVTAPTLADVTTTTYRAYVVAGGAIVANDTNIGSAGGTDNDSNNYYNFPNGTATDINLKAGQTLVFVTAPAGAAWTATDILDEDDAVLKTYTAEVTVTVGGLGEAARLGVGPGKSLATGDRIISETGFTGADFVNILGPVLPLGITTENLPYVGLIALAFLGFAAYTALKVRGRRREAACGREAYN